MNELTCRSCDHYTQETAKGSATLILCAKLGKEVRLRPLAICKEASYRPGRDEAEDWDELPDGEGFV